MEHCKAYRIFNENKKIEGSIVEVPTADIGRGEVVFQTAYSSVNFKDALAATGAGGKIIRNYPLIGGIDAAGTVLSSSDARFKPGDEILCTSYDMGVAHDGGYSGLCRVPGSCPCPRGCPCLKPWPWAQPVTRQAWRWNCSS
jgi:acrylyl-CoA reductase (NADPH)